MPHKLDAVPCEIAHQPERSRQLLGERFGVQPEDVQEIAPAPPPPSLRDQLMAFGHVPAGPPAETQERLAEISKARAESRARFQSNVRQDDGASSMPNREGS